ncbi:hypothetical protein V1517DRAFT_318436 [Lipomyces orientalis]|uniref:Uncharacterized protein n=1 Tax=Lipomyces orientalis TaxID=1233043 RepID=A0ACC3TSL2_9ASCO
MSKRQQLKNEALLRELSELPENRKCADCGARNPGWASWNLGVFLCIRCGGIHRKMGTHISKVKSLSVDSWTTEQILAMKEMGNKKANSIWDPNNERSQYLGSYDGDDDSVVERYIRDKYERGKFRRDMEDFVQERGAYNDDYYNSSSRSGQSSSSSRWFRRSKKNQSNGDDFLNADRESGSSRRNKTDDIYHINERRDTRKKTYEYDDDYEYEDKMFKLLDMGFTDRKRNLEALTKSKGDIPTAIEFLTNADESERRPALPPRPSNSGPSSHETSQAPSRNDTGAASQQPQYTGVPSGRSQTVYDQFGNPIGVVPVQQFQPPSGPPPQFAQQNIPPQHNQQQPIPPQPTGAHQSFQPPPHPPPGFQNPVIPGAQQSFSQGSGANQQFPPLSAGLLQSGQVAPQATGYNQALHPTNGYGTAPSIPTTGITPQQSQISSQRQQQSQPYSNSLFLPQPSSAQNGTISTGTNLQPLEQQWSTQQQSAISYQSADLLAGLGNPQTSSSQQQPASLTSALQNLSLQSSQPQAPQTLLSNPQYGQQQQQVANPLVSQPADFQRPQATGYPPMSQSNISFPSQQPQHTQSALQQSQPLQPVFQQPQATGLLQYRGLDSVTQPPPLPASMPQQQPLLPQLTQQAPQFQQQPFAQQQQTGQYPSLQQPMPTGYGPKVDKYTILSLYSHPDYYSSPVSVPGGGVNPAPANNSQLGAINSTQTNGGAVHDEVPSLKPGQRNPFLTKQQPATQPQQQSRDGKAQREQSVRFDDFNGGRVSPDAFGQLSAWTGGSNARKW